MTVINLDNERAARIYKNLNEPAVTVVKTSTEPETVDTVYGDKQKKIIENIGTPATASDTHYTKNYGANGGDEWVVRGKLITPSEGETAEKTATVNSDSIY